LNIAQMKIITNSSRTTSNQFQHEVCQTFKSQILSYTSDLLLQQNTVSFITPLEQGFSNCFVLRPT